MRRSGYSAYNANYSMSADRIVFDRAPASFLHCGIRLVRELD